ncbi:MAG: hypothetical protein Kow00121_17570 [Elainellaceae cyanobacterium]
MINALQPFGAPDCESDLAILGEDRYSKYYFHFTHFNRESLDPSVYLIVGRRGSGKTALTRFFSFQKVIQNSIEVDIDEPIAFHEVMSKIVEVGSFNRELQIPRLVKIWEYVIWSAIFHELKSKDARIRAACTLDGEEGVSKIIRLLLQSLLNKYLGTEDDLLDELDRVFRSATFKQAKEAVLEFAHKHPLIVAVDTLEKYSVNDEKLMITIAALVEFAAMFCREYAQKNIHVKVFMMDEIFPYLIEDYISNTLKYVKDEIYLHWKPKDLMRMICWRLFQYLRLKDLSKLKTADIDWNNHRDVKEKIWKSYFGEWIENGGNIKEKTFPYVLRHTQLRPRQLIVLCNSIAKQSLRSKNFPNFSPRDMFFGIQSAGVSLADEVFNAYSSAYPNAARIADALSGIPPIFRAKELDRRAPQTASQWLDDYSPYRFRQFVAELGIVGRVRHRNEATGIVEADFEYFKRGRLIISTDDLCVIHPMFYTKLNVSFSEKLCIYPFPDHEEFVGLNYG